MELFPRFCCWTLIWLLRHWAWLRWGYWRYRSLIDWLIDLPLHSVAWSRVMLSLIISMLMIASCIFPLYQATLLQDWMVYNHAWPLSSTGGWQINWNWTQIKRNSSSLGINGNGENLSMFPIELLGFKTYPSKSARNLGVIFNKNFSFRSHICNLQLTYLPHPRSTSFSPSSRYG